MSYLTSDNIKLTPEGGLAVRRTNKTGSNSIQGYVVETDASIANAVDLVGVGDPDPIGVFYESGIADGEEAWVVVSGIADVHYVGNTTLNDFSRVTVTADTGDAPGKAISEAKPTAPFSTDKHFQEIGHVLEARVGEGLAKTILHFN